MLRLARRDTPGSERLHALRPGLQATSCWQRRPSADRLEHVKDQIAATGEAPDADASGAVEAAGRFRIYLGAAAGVGKTYAMLNEGHRRLGRGTDVVVGFVECHGRQRTEQMIGGLEVVSRRRWTTGAAIWKKWTSTRY